MLMNSVDLPYVHEKSRTKIIKKGAVIAKGKSELNSVKIQLICKIWNYLMGVTCDLDGRDLVS